MKPTIMTTKSILTAISICAAFSSSSYALEEIGATSTELEPTAAPLLPTVGSKRVIFSDGEETTYTVTEVTDTHVSNEGTDGCKWITPVKDYIVIPSEGWTNCSDSSGIAKVKAKGSIFPLKKGKKSSYSVKGETTEGSWTGKWTEKRKCKVAGAVRIKTVSGEHDTWKVVCKGPHDKKTRYFSPALGMNVASVKKHFTKSHKSWTSELVRSE